MYRNTVNLNLPYMGIGFVRQTPTTVCGLIDYNILDSIAMIDGSVLLGFCWYLRNLLLHFDRSTSLSVWHRPNNNFM